jgi:hypothetical protein
MTGQVQEMTAGKRSEWQNVSALIALVAMFFTASTAHAATSIGSTAPPGLPSICGTNLLEQESSSGPSYAVPSGGGVISSWSVQGSSLPGQVTLKVVRETTPDYYLVEGSSGVQTALPNQLNTYPTRLAVAAGNEIALYAAGAGAPCDYYTGNDADVQTYLFSPGGTPDPAVGTTVGPNQYHEPGYLLNVSAGVEPDADHDGYGDETQDLCPIDPTKQDSCRAAALKKCKKKAKKHDWSHKRLKKCKKKARLLPV